MDLIELTARVIQPVALQRFEIDGHGELQPLALVAEIGVEADRFDPLAFFFERSTGLGRQGLEEFDDLLLARAA